MTVEPRRLRPSDRVSWHRPLGRRYGIVLATQTAANGLQVAWIQALVGFPRFTAAPGGTLQIENELPARLADMPAARRL